MSRAGWAGVTAIIVLLLAAAPAAADWGPAIKLAGRGAEAKAIAQDARGRATVVLVRRDGRRDHLDVFREDASGRFRLLRRLATGARSSFARRPAVAGVDAQGRAVVVWFAPDGERLYANVDGRRTVLRASEGAGTPAMVVDPDGRSVLTWRSGKTMDLYVAERGPGAARFGSPRRLGVTRFQPRLASDGRGGAVVAWAPSTNRVAAVVRPRGGVFGAAQDLRAGGPAIYGLALAMGPSGRAVVVWERLVRVRPYVWGLEGAERLAESPSFEPARPIGTDKEENSPDQVTAVITPGGDAMIAWTEQCGGVECIATARWPTGGAPTSTGPVSNPAREVSMPSLVVDERGRVVVAYNRNPASEFGPWFSITNGGRPQRIGEEVDEIFPRLAPGPRGPAAVWNVGDDDFETEVNDAVYFARLR